MTHLKYKRKAIYFNLVLCLIFALQIRFLASIVRAGSLTPSAPPSATFYTLGDIYTRLTTNAPAVEGDHSFSPDTSPASSLYTLKEIYEAIPTINGNVLKLGTNYLGIDGTLTPDGGTASTGDLFSGKTAHLSGDWSLDVGTLNLACNTETFDGVANLVDDAYDGDGDGFNRFCITDSGNATSTDLLSGKIAWVDGIEVTGIYDASNLAIGTVKTGTAFGDGETGAYPSVDHPLPGDTAAPDAGAVDVCSGFEFWTKTGLATTGSLSVSADTIAAGKTICGTTGTLLANLFNGTGVGFAGGSQTNGGVDDWNNGSPPPTDSYSSSWTQCVIENNYCGTGLPSADAKDDTTNLIYSFPCNGVGCSSFSNSSPLTYTWDNSSANNNSQTASEICSAGSHEESGWSLPHQKQLMQAYINGAYGNLEASGVARYYWSATTQSTNTANAWRVVLSIGTVHTTAKSTSVSVRCVRSGE